MRQKGRLINLQNQNPRNRKELMKMENLYLPESLSINYGAIAEKQMVSQFYHDLGLKLKNAKLHLL